MSNDLNPDWVKLDAEIGRGEKADMRPACCVGRWQTGMTPSEINAAIAEWMGWKPIDKSYDGKTVYWWRSPEGRELPSPPNYYADLNACANARSKLTEEQQWAYVECLGGMATHKNALWRLTNATAPEHCETLLRVLNLWKE